jgi:transcriptional regulator with XRE-family HTH domain
MQTLRKVRREKELTQEEISRTLGITQAYLCQLEKGIRSPSMALQRKIDELIDKLYSLY